MAAMNPYVSDAEVTAIFDKTRAKVIAEFVAKERAFELDVAEVVEEVKSARVNWPAFNSAHEGYAILLEEMDELWDIVKVNQKKRDLVKMRAEAKQVAAMAIRFMGDCTDEINGRK